MATIFVFGSNLAGRHSKGAALEAYKNYGAIYGQGRGLQGNSYAIPTKDKSLRALPLHYIKYHVDIFLKFAAMKCLINPNMVFIVTPIGCGLAGYTPEQVAPMFSKALELPNISLPTEFMEILQPEPKPKRKYTRRKLDERI